MTIIGVDSPELLERHRRLFDSIAVAAGVRFEALTEASPAALAAIVGSDAPDGEPPSSKLPRLSFTHEAAAGGGGSAGGDGAVLLSSCAQLDRPLRGRALQDSDAALVGGIALAPSAEILAKTRDGRVLWTHDDAGGAGHQRVALALPQLHDSEHLRSRLRPGRFLAVLALLHFARRLAAEHGTWSPPPTRASIVIDDPNLHGTRYGHIDLRRLATDAREHDYHVCCATVPLDATWAQPRAVAIFRRHSTISLMVHGNNHLSRELGAQRTPAEADAQLAQAYRRISRLEARTGLAVQRLMAPPHGACSEISASAMVRCGFEAATISRAFPWREQPPADRPLAGTWPADIVGDGLPIISRIAFQSGTDDLVLRAWLGVPLVLYGHHAEAVGDFELFRSARAFIEDLGGAAWMSPQAIARSNLATRAQGNELHVRLWSRRAELVVPAGSDTLRLQALPEGEDHATVEIHNATGSIAQLRPGEACKVAGGDQLRLLRLPVRSIDPFTTPAPGPAPWALPRRTLVELRDRAQGAVGRIF